MRRLSMMVLGVSLATACGASQPAGHETGSGSGARAPGSQQGDGEATGAGEFQLSTSDTAGQARGERPSEIVANDTHAAMRLFVVDPDAGPLQGIVIKMTAPDGTAYYTGESDAQGYAEVLVPVGRRYEMEYLSLGRRNTTASVDVPPGPNQDLRLTMRHRRWRPPPRPPQPAQPPEAAPQPPGFVLDGILFDSNRATLQPESFPRLDRVVEYMTHRTSARIRVAGHTDNVGNARQNMRLSEQRAQAVRDYLVSHGIDAARIEAVGYGDQHPVASNDTEDGQRQNRRIEAIEL